MPEHDAGPTSGDLIARGAEAWSTAGPTWLSSAATIALDLREGHR